MATFVFLLCLAPAFGPVWHAAFGAEIDWFHDYLRVLDSPVDPWGRAWIPDYMDALHSAGPDGINDGGKGDDLVIGTLGRPIPSPKVAIYGRAPLDYVVALVLLLGTFLAARNARPRRSRGGELAMSLLLAAPLTGGTLWTLYEFWPYWQFATTFQEYLLAPVPLAVAGSVALTYLVIVLAIRHLSGRKLYRNGLDSSVRERTHMDELDPATDFPG